MSGRNFFSPVIRTHGLTDADLESLTAILRKAVDDHTVPGVSLLLAHKGEVVCKKSVGNLALDQKALVGLELQTGHSNNSHDPGRPSEALTRRPGRKISA